MINKQNISKIYFLFLSTHIFIWTVVPTIFNINLPLDTIEALAWGSNMDWGFEKHPPFSAFAVDFFYRIFGNQDWAYYLLSQIFVVSAFISVFKLAKEFFKNEYIPFLSILLLEGIFFYNYTSPEFNVNISQLPFWGLSIYFSWRCIKDDKLLDHVLLGLFIGLGFLSKYLFLYLIFGIYSLFFYLLQKKKIKSYNFLISGFIFLIMIFPHLLWLIDNDYKTLMYGLNRTGNSGNIIDHAIFPSTFILKQIGILLPFVLMALSLLKKIKLRKIIIDEKIVFLIFTFVLPILLVILTSLLMGAKIRTMWMTPFYLLAGLAFLKIYEKNLNLTNLKKFTFSFLFLFLLSPTIYALVSVSNDSKRTDYQGKEIARLVQNKWDDNFRNEIKIVVGDEWFAGNLSYHLKSRPKWTIELKNELKNLKVDEGIVYTGNPKILKNVCPGVYGTIKPVGYCMIGRR